MALVLGRAFDARPFRFEHAAFALTLLPLLLRRRPDVVYLSEWDTARVLAAVRPLTGLRYKLLLSNGTLAPSGFEHLDRVQDLTPAARQFVIDRGGDPRRHVVVPLGFHIAPTLVRPSADERAALRERLGLPVDRRIALSVAALNRHHKRLDYVIEAVASMPETRPFLLLAGEREEETPGLEELARERLPADGYSFRTVPAEQVRELHRASDVFVLASTYEGLPRALIEASASGLPCVVHEYPVTEYSLGPSRHSADLTQPGALTELLAGLTEEDLGPGRAAALHRHAYENFSWDRLRPRYVELLREVANEPRP
jgi:glycosyltransferase involved in cell wall biosynthesis